MTGFIDGRIYPAFLSHTAKGSKRMRDEKEGLGGDSLE
jgi:hypothetical protein